MRGASSTGLSPPRRSMLKCADSLTLSLPTALRPSLSVSGTSIGRSAPPLKQHRRRERGDGLQRALRGRCARNRCLSREAANSPALAMELKEMPAPAAFEISAWLSDRDEKSYR